jgi:hypothetical protein
MIRLSKNLFSFVWGNLGYCKRCIRKAFQTAAIGWSLVTFATVLGQPRTLTATLTIASAGLTLLWVAHLVAYARKATAYIDEKSASAESPNSPGAKIQLQSSSRRDVIPLFARMIAGAAIASAIATPAFADSACGGYNGECNRCARRNTPNSPCEWCHSCGSNCRQDNNC